MSYLLDILVILILLLFIYLGYRRGFVKTIIQLVGSLVAMALAFVLSIPISAGIYDTFISQQVRDSMADSVAATDREGILDSAEQLLDDLPDMFTNALKQNGLGTPQDIYDKVKDEAGNTKDALIDAVESKIVRPVAVAVLRPIVFFPLFIILMVIILIISRLLNTVFQLPGLKQINEILGALAGVVQGVVALFVLVTILSAVSYTVKPDSLASRDTVDRTYIVRRLETVNPLNDALNKLTDG